MARKPKGKQPQAVQEHKSPKVSQGTEKASNLLEKTESLVRHNGLLIEDLIRSEAWLQILSPLIDETIASVSGRKTNGRWHHGDFTRTKEDTQFLKGYQKSAMDIHNRLMDFIKAKDDIDKKHIQEVTEAQAPIVNPFMEEDTDGWKD